MNCPACQHTKTKVFDRRMMTKQNVVWRRHQCFSCKHRFTTREIEDSVLTDLLSKVEELRGILRTRETLARLLAAKS